MKNHYDICVAGFWYGSNYGSLLNGYAEYRLLKEMGKEVLMLQKPISPDAPVIDKEITEGHNVRFVKKYYDPEDISIQYRYNELKELNAICDCFCAGSDQIWNYNLSFHENLYMPFVSDDKKLISFATSFGHKVDKTPRDSMPTVRKYLERYSAISVREQFDVDILKNNYGLKGELVFEPVFCIDKKYYDELIDNSSFNEEEPYLLTYILDPNDAKREAVLYYAEKSGLKVVNILNGNDTVWERNKNLLNLPNIVENVGAEDFLKAFKNASYVITDSFHGSAFSIIFNKPFLAIGNFGRGYERFNDLLGRLKLMDRLVDPRNIPHDEKYLAPIDYTETNRIISEEAARTVAWLKNAVNTPKEKFESVVTHRIYADFERARQIVALVKEYGIKHVVISSGTRNVSLARLFEANSDYFKLYNVTDERSAAYFAIGLSTKLHETVAICCTSGTAVSNYVPGVTEAYYQNVPLLVITADRHPSLNGNLEDQTITQYGLFSTITKKAVTMPVNSEAANMWEARVKICDAILEINHHGTGPVQINLPQSGLELRPSPKYALVLPKVKKISRIELGDKSAVWEEALGRLVKAPRVMVIYGQNYKPDEYDQSLIDRFAEKFNCVIVADHLSNIHGDKVVYPYRILKKLSAKEYNRALTPNIVIQLGGKRILNDPLTSKLRSGSVNIELWRVNEDGRVADLYRRLTTVWECSQRQFLEYCVNCSPEDIHNDGKYYDLWVKKMKELEPVNVDKWQTYYTIYRTMKALPANSILHLAVGHTFVQAQDFEMDNSIEVFCNMGTNGIDGCASSFMGQAEIAGDNQLCFLFIGDLSFFYDMNSLWNKRKLSNVRILLNNDSGAGLLRYHRSIALTQSHNAVAEGWVKSLGFRYLTASNKEEFEENLKIFVSPDEEGPIFFETFVP